MRVHILHHAAEGEVYGQWLIEELASHSYRISPGTLYPMLQVMEELGYLTSHEDFDGRLGHRRKVYTATPEGRRGLAVARERLRELTGEVKHEARAPQAEKPSDRRRSQRRRVRPIGVIF